MNKEIVEKDFNNCPSEVLRQLVAIYEDLPLEEYAWDEDLKKEIFSIPTDIYIEEHVSNLGEAYKNGYNIGHCGTTSRYLSIHFPEALVHYGKTDLLIGTKNSSNGSHAWIEMNNFVLDPTLMIKFPVNYKELFKYQTSKVLAKLPSLILSEYDTFDLEYYHMINDPDYMQKILTKK